MKLTEIIIKGESLLVIEALQQETSLSWNLMIICKNIKQQLLKFQSWEAHFCCHFANEVSNSLAKVVAPIDDIH